MKKIPDTAPVRKFMFEQSFDDASIVHRAQERKPVLMKPEQMDAMKQESYDAGFAAGKTAGRAAEEEAQAARLAVIIAQLDKSLTELIGHLSGFAREQDRHTRELVMAVAKKILPTFAARQGLDEIGAVLESAIRDMAREPRLVVRVNQDQFDAVNEKAQAIAAQRAYSGKLIVIADADVAACDCRVEWADGGVARDAQSTWNAIEQTILPPT